MIQTFITITPILILFCIGVFSRKINIIDENVSTKFLRFLFYFVIPALILSNYKKYSFTPQNFTYPLFSMTHLVIMLAVSFLIVKLVKLERKTKGTFILSTTIMNTGFLLPLVLLDMGNEQIITLILFDLGNAVVVFTLIYIIAVYYGTGKPLHFNMVFRILTIPPLWALLTALLLNKTGITLPQQIENTVDILGKMTIPLTFIILGAKFDFKIYKLNIMFAAIFIKIVVGFSIALLLAKLFGFSQTGTQLALLIGATPSGYNSIVFSDLEKLDTKLAVNTVSISMLVCIVLYPFIKVLAGFVS